MQQLQWKTNSEYLANTLYNDGSEPFSLLVFAYAMTQDISSVLDFGKYSELMHGPSLWSGQCQVHVLPGLRNSVPSVHRPLVLLQSNCQGQLGLTNICAWKVLTWDLVFNNIVMEFHRYNIFHPNKVVTWCVMQVKRDQYV